MTVERTIQQAAEETGVSDHTLRYYERIGLILSIKRGPNGHRRYSDEDVEWIIFLKQLKATGMPLAQMQAFAALRIKGDDTARQRREMLEAHRQSVVLQMQILTDCLTMIDYKIERHRRTEARTSTT